MKKSISVTLDEDILEKAKQLAVYDGRSVSQYINQVLKSHIANREKKFNGSLFPNQD